MRLLLSLVISFLLVSGSAFAKTPKILKISDLKPGTKAIGFSVFQGIEPEHFDVELGEATELLQLNLILARLSGGPMPTLLEKIGPVAGMSGSPIFIDCNDLDDCINNGVLVGALSYGLGSFIEGGMNFMITPAESMLGAGAGGYVAVSQLTNLPPKVSFQGREYNSLMLYPNINSLAEGVGSSSKCTDFSAHTLKPGSMVAIYLAWGQMAIAASGTVTWVDDNQIYVFGHPLFGAGIVHYPFSHVSVAATLQTPQQPHKIAGCYLDTNGLMIFDGAYEVAGVIGGKASLLPFQVDLNVGGQVVSLHEEIAPSPIARAIINVLPSMWAQSLLGDIDDLSVAYQIRIAIRNEPEIFVRSIISAQTQTSVRPFDGVINRLDEVIFKNLEAHGFVNRMEKVLVQVNFVGNLKTWKAKTSFLSQKSAVPGETVYVNIVLEESSSRAIKQISIPVKVPNDFMDRLETGDINTISVFVQSGSKFIDKQDAGFKKPASPENIIKELNTAMNRQMNVLYVQQVMPKTKSDKESNRDSAKSATKSPWKWNDLELGELSQLPLKDDLQVILSTTSELEHFIDFDATFSVVVKPKTETKESKTDQEKTDKKSRKWFLLFLY